MRRCRWCNALIRHVEVANFMRWASSPPRRPITLAALVCVLREVATQNDPNGINDDHEPEPYDLPPAMDPASVSRWLDV